MNLIPPALLVIGLPAETGRRFRLWLPLILLWPLLWLLELIVLVPALAVDIACWLVGREYHHYSLLLLRVFGLLGDTRGLIIRVAGPGTDVETTFV